VNTARGGDRAETGHAPKRRPSGSGQANAELSRVAPRGAGRAAADRRRAPSDLGSDGGGGGGGGELPGMDPAAGWAPRVWRRRRRRRAGGGGDGGRGCVVCGSSFCFVFFYFCALAGWVARSGRR
jgi:hypothetical protein